MDSLFTTALVFTTTALAALGGCLGETNEPWLQIEFRSLYEKDRYVEAWNLDEARQPDESTHWYKTNIGPNDGRGEPRLRTSFPCEGAQAHFHVAMKEYTGVAGSGTAGSALANKTWLIPDCHKPYTVLIEQEGTMSLYQCDAKAYTKDFAPCSTRGSALTPISE